MNLPYSKKVGICASFLGLCQVLVLLVLVTVTLVIGAQIRPAVSFLTPAIGDPDLYSTRTITEFASRGLVWAALGIATILLLAATFIYSMSVVVGVLVKSTGKSKIFSYIILATPIIFVAPIVLIEIYGGNGFSGLENRLFMHGWTQASMAWFTLPANMLTMMAIAALYAASAAIIRSVIQSPKKAKDHSRQLQLLLVLGALSTVSGVAEIRQLHRFEGSLSLGRIGSSDEREMLSRAYRETLCKEAKEFIDPKSRLPIDSLLWHYGEVALGAKVNDALRTSYITAIAGDIRDSCEASTVLNEAVTTLIIDTTELKSLEAVVQADQLAMHYSIFWGLVFAAALAGMYFPAAQVLIKCAGAESREDVKSMVAIVPSAESGSSWKDFTKPFLRLLATLAPLLVGVVQEWMNSLLNFVAG